MTATTPIDVYTFGEAMLRLSVPPGDRLRTAPAYAVSVGGAESNIAMALARLGRRVAWGSRLPRTELGRRVGETIAATGVDTSAVVWTDDGRLGTYFTELRAAPAVPMVIYDRAGSAATALCVDDLDPVALDSARWVHTTGITPALSAQCRAATREAVERVWCRGGRVSVDVNYRARLWSPDEARDTVDELAKFAALMICSAEDAGHVFECFGDPTDVVRRLADRWSCAQVVLTIGANGVVWVDGDAVEAIDGIPTPHVIDRLGAGDALAAGTIHGAIDGDLGSGIRLGVAMATITLGTRGDAYPGTLAEAADLIGERARRVDR
jgi:2-dehydro-3-deoxygluconokinase